MYHLIDKKFLFQTATAAEPRHYRILLYQGCLLFYIFCAIKDYLILLYEEKQAGMCHLDFSILVWYDKLFIFLKSIIAYLLNAIVLLIFSSHSIKAMPGMSFLKKGPELLAQHK